MSGFFNDNLLKCKPKKGIVEELGQSMLDTRLRGFYAHVAHVVRLKFKCNIEDVCHMKLSRDIDFGLNVSYYR